MAVVTHMGQPPANHVVLEAYGGPDGTLFFVRTLPDGSVAPGPGNTLEWRIPSNDVLVITDVDWQYIHPEGAAASGLIQTLRLFIQNLTNRDDNVRVFESTITLSAQGQGGISEGMTSGFVVSPAAKISADLFPGPMGPPWGLQHLLLRGYLIQTRPAPIEPPVAGGTEVLAEK